MQKKTFYRPTYPIFSQAVTGNKQFIFLGLIKKSPNYNLTMALYIDIMNALYHN